MAEKKRDRYYYLNAAADRVSKEAYTLTRSLRGRDGVPADVKTLKEMEGVLKEAVGIALSLEKTGDAHENTLRVVFDEGIEEMSG